MNDFARRILRWFDAHGRKDLPWQREINPYRVWVSEIMLQQTQVQTVIPYFDRFMASFPDLAALADADIDRVLHHWSGLGYYARARNLHAAAVLIQKRHGGGFPASFDEVLALPGIGRSTAGAILAISRSERHPILDGNVKRVLARHAAVAGWPGKTDVGKRLWQLAEARTPRRRVADYTQAIMDLGATLCRRGRPDCGACPVAADCVARLTDTVAAYPGRKPDSQKSRPLRATTMLMAVCGDAVLLERRPPAGVWGGLWSLPEVESIEAGCEHYLDQAPEVTETRERLRHSFSHFDLDICPVLVRVSAQSRKVADNPDVTWHPLHDELPGGIAAPVQQLLNSLKSR